MPGDTSHRGLKARKVTWLRSILCYVAQVYRDQTFTNVFGVALPAHTLEHSEISSERIEAKCLADTRNNRCHEKIRFSKVPL